MSRIIYHTSSAMALLDPLLNAFLDPERKRQRNLLQGLIQKNSALGGHAYGYYHAGQVFSLLTPRNLKGIPLKTIHPSLQDSADHLLLIRDRLAADSKRLVQGLSVILPRCKDLQDIRDAFPETLVHLICDLDLPRTREEGYILEDQPMLRSQYEQVVNIALDYQAKRLIY